MRTEQHKPIFLLVDSNHSVTFTLLMMPTAQVWQTVSVHAHLSLSRGVSDGIIISRKSGHIKKPLLIRRHFFKSLTRGGPIHGQTIQACSGSLPVTFFWKDGLGKLFRLSLTQVSQLNSFLKCYFRNTTTQIQDDAIERMDEKLRKHQGKDDKQPEQTLRILLNTNLVDLLIHCWRNFSLS